MRELELGNSTCPRGKVYRGGHDAMAACYYIMNKFGPQAKHPEARRLYSGVVSAYWHGVGEWHD